tara:strand:- start:29 stop:3205 length:3177 start_codon:yes stop_codon:yes gene_type:complete
MVKKLDLYEAITWMENPTNPAGRPAKIAQTRDYDFYVQAYNDHTAKDIGNSIQGILTNDENLSLDMQKVDTILDSFAINDRYTSAYLELQTSIGSRVGDISDTESKVKGITGLRVKDFRFDKGYFLSLSGKRSNYSAHPISARLTNILKEHIEFYALEGDDYLFPSIKKGANITSVPIIADKQKPVAQGTIRKKFNARWDALFPGTRPPGDSTHRLRHFFASLMAQIRLKAGDNTITDAYVSSQMKQMNKAMKKIYESGARNVGTGIQEIKLSPRMRDIINTHTNFADKTKNLLLGLNSWKEEAPKAERKTSVTKKPRTRYEDDPIAVEKALRQILGKDADIKVPQEMAITDVVGKVYGPSDYEKLTKSYARGWSNYGFAKAMYDKANIQAADNLYNLDNLTLVKYSEPLSPKIADKIVLGVLEKFNPAYYNRVDNTISAIVEKSRNYEYDAKSLVDVVITDPKKIPKAPTGTVPGAVEITDTRNWWTRSGLDELFGDAYKITGNKPAVRLDSNVINEIMEAFEEESRFKMIADKMSSQTSHFTIPEEVANDGASRLTVRNTVLENSLNKLYNKNSGISNTLGFSRSQRPISENLIITNIKNNLKNANLRADYSSLDTDFLKRIVDNNPEVFPELSTLKGKYDEDFIYRMRLEPTLQYLYSEGVIPKTTLLGDVSQQYDSLFKGNLKDQYRTLKKQYFTAKGLPTKNKKIQWLFDWRTNAFSDDFAAIAYDTPQSITQNEVKKLLPIIDFGDLEIDSTVPATEIQVTEAVEDQAKPKKHQKSSWLNMNKTRYGMAAPSALLVGLQLAPQVKFGKAATVFGKGLTEIAALGLEQAAFADMSGQGKGILGERLQGTGIELPTGEIIYPNTQDVTEQVRNLSPEGKVYASQLDLKDYGYDTSVDVGFIPRHMEEFKDIGRQITAAGSAIGSTQIQDANLFSQTVEELDKREAEDKKSRNIRGAVTQQNLESFIPDLEEKADIENRLRGYGSDVKKAKQLNPRGTRSVLESAKKAQTTLDEIDEARIDIANKDLEKTQNIIEEMNKLNFTNQPKGENDAVNG